MARLTQTQIIATLAETTGLKKTEVKGLMDSLAELAIGEVKKNGEFTVPGFGKLKKTNRKAREGRNPATGRLGLQRPAGSRSPTFPLRSARP